MSQLRLSFLLAPQAPSPEPMMGSTTPARTAPEPQHSPLCWQARLAQLVDVSVPNAEALDDQHLPVGLALGYEALQTNANKAPCLRADPVHMVPDRDRALLLPPESLDLSPEEERSLVADLNTFLKDDGLTLFAAHPHRWYVQGEFLVPMQRPPPAQLAYTDVGPETSHGGTEGDAQQRRRLRTLISEIEMYLYTHPVNEARRSTARPVVSGLYLWGSFDRLHSSSAEQTILVGDDPWVRYLAEVTGATISDAQDLTSLLESVFDTSDDEPLQIVVVETAERQQLLAANIEQAQTARARFDAQWLEPATAALQAGTIESAVCEHDDGSRHEITIRHEGWVRRVLQRVFG